MLINATIDDDIRSWIKEDIPFWDMSLGDLGSGSTTTAVIISKSNGKIAGIHIAKRVFEITENSVEIIKDDGEDIKVGDEILRIVGPPDKILQAERVALNLLSHLSGICTRTASMVELLRRKGLATILAATRKTIPGLRKYQKYAVQLAGGDTHRLSLSSMVMIKENHIKAFGGIEKAVDRIRNTTSFASKIEVEVTDRNEAIEAANKGVDVIMLDNFSPKEIEEILPEIREINSNILTEASGNITEENMLAYANSGIDIISMGSLTHSVRAFDVSLLIEN